MIYFVATDLACAGGSKSQTIDCCTTDAPCEVNEGDCDRDSECKGDLVCGDNNCDQAFTWRFADCCTERKYFILDKYDTLI